MNIHDQRLPKSLERYHDADAGHRPYPDLHAHVVELARKGLLIAVNEPIDKSPLDHHHLGRRR